MLGMMLDGYIRVSQVRGREGDSFLSPDQQREKIEMWATLHGHEIAEWFTDLDQSGGKMNRPGFAQMMLRIERGQTQGVVVAKLDRFARSLPGALEAIAFLDKHGALFVSVAEGVDPSNTAGKMMMRLLLVLAEFELDRIRDNWRDALTNAIEVRGIQPTVAPFGYRKNGKRQFIIDPDEGPIVKEIFRRALSGQTWASIARWLNDEGIKPRQSLQWNGETVKQLSRREVYTGVVKKGKIRNEAAHETLVSKADFLAVRRVFAKSGETSSETRHALNGILRCAGCSRQMSGRGYKPKGRERIPAYNCQVTHTAGTCPAPANVNESVIMPYVMESFFAKLAEDEELVLHSNPESVELTEAIDTERAVRTLREEFLADTSFQSEFGMNAFKSALRAHNEAVRRAADALERAQRKATGIDLPPAAMLREMWPSLNASEHKRLLASAIRAIYVSRVGSGSKRPVDQRVHIVWRTDDHPFELSGPGKSVPIRTFTW